MSFVARENKEEEEEEKEWSDLPWDLLYFISLRLYAGDSIMFRAVCKCWQSIPVPPPKEIDRPLNDIDPQLRDIPYFMNVNRRTGLIHFHHPITHVTHMVDLPDLVEGDLRFSKDGWVLVTGRPESVFFFNPFTKTRIEVPEIPIPCGFQIMHFTCPPTLSDCTVFGVFSGFKDVEVGTFMPGEETWFIQTFENNTGFLMSKCSPVLYNGLYHCLGYGGNVGIFDPVNDTWNILGKPLDRLKKFEQTYLFESDGDLIGVFVGNDGRKTEVLRLEISSELVWHEIESLEDKMFYLCYGSSYSNKAPIGGAGNTICFPMLYNDEMLFYSLGTRRYHSFRGNFSKQDLLDTKEMKHGIWINMPIQGS